MVAFLARAGAAPALCILASVLFLLSALTPARANVMEFTGIPGGCGAGAADFVADGIRASFVSAYYTPDVLHMADGGTGCPIFVDFTMDGPFDAVSADIFPLGQSAYCAQAGLDDPPACGLPFSNVRWQGFRASTVVASAHFWMAETDFTYVFGPAFAGIDRLMLAATFPATGEIGGLTYFCRDVPCAFFEVDNLTLVVGGTTVIPVPATAWLLASALALLGFVRGRPRRA